MMEAIFRRVAKRELQDAASWYEDHSPGLGGELVQGVTDCVELTRNHPEIFPSCVPARAPSNGRRFPFLLFYYVESESFTIISVFHSSRNPQIWKRRV